MPEKRLNIILYCILTVAVLLYFHIIALPYFKISRVRQELPCGETIPSGEWLMEEEKQVNSRKSGNLPRSSLESWVSAESSVEPGEFKEDESSVELQEKNEAEERKINSNGYHLYVDLDRTQMFVYKDGKLIKTYGVSGGKASSPSPVGTWKIISKDTWGEGFGGAWMGFNVPWGMYGIHGTTEPWSIGRSNTSKGCIRMKNADVRELYKMIPYHTLVTIIYKNRPFYPMRDGDVGADVLEVEKALKKLGYYYGSEDGIFGDALKTAVRKFQKENRLYQTGVINNSTYELIMKMSRELED